MRANVIIIIAIHDNKYKPPMMECSTTCVSIWKRSTADERHSSASRTNSNIIILMVFFPLYSLLNQTGRNQMLVELGSLQVGRHSHCLVACLAGGCSHGSVVTYTVVQQVYYERQVGVKKTLYHIIVPL